MKITKELLEKWIKEYPSLNQASKILNIHRKSLYNATKQYNLFFSGQLANSPKTEDICAKNLQIQVLSSEVTQLRKKLGEQTLIADAINNLVGKGYSYRAPSKYVHIDNPNKEEETMVVNISDTHIGQLITPEEVGGLEEYNIEVFMERLGRFETAVHRFLDIINSYAKVNRIVLNYLGDIVEGHGIFRGQESRVEVDAGEAMWIGAQAFSQFEIRLLDHLHAYAGDKAEIHTLGITGNHGIPGGKHGGAGLKKTTNWDYQFYRTKSLLEQQYPQIKHYFSKTWYQPFKIYDWMFLSFHGDKIMSHYGIPYYGLERASLQYTNLLQEQIDYFCSAHIHRPVEIPVGAHKEMFINGAWPSANELTETIRQAAQPTQLLFSVHPENAVTIRAHIWLEKPRKKVEGLDIINLTGE